LYRGVIYYKTDDQKDIYYYINLIGIIILFFYSIILSTIIFLNALKFLFNKNAGLFINDFGIDNNLGVIGRGKLQWHDITDILVLKSKSEKARMIVIKIGDPEKYLFSKNFIQKHFLKIYIRKYGSPVIIPKNTIDYKLEELATLISDQLKIKKDFKNYS
jgi:hypothetical protein